VSIRPGRRFHQPTIAPLKGWATTTGAAGQQEGENQGGQDATDNLPENQGGRDADTPALLADARQQALDVMRRLGDARFATNGDDLLAAGYPPGAALANQLRTLRRAWLADLLCQRK